MSQVTAVDDVVAAASEFGIDLLAQADGDNAVVSPASIAVALAMVAEGAQGPARGSLDEFLAAADEDRSEAFSALQTAWAEYDGDPAVAQDDELPERPLLHLAGQLVAAEEHHVEQDFLDALTSRFDAEVLSADLVDPGTQAVLDDWVDEHTGGLIEESSIEPGPGLVFVLQNAVLLAARWKSPFAESDTREEPFADPSGRQSAVDTMHQTLSAAYADEPGGQVLRLPNSEGFAMDVLLPEEGTAPEELTPTTMRCRRSRPPRWTWRCPGLPSPPPHPWSSR